MTSSLYPNETVHAAIEARVLAHPERAAVRDATRAYTYAALWRRAGSIAQALVKDGVKRGDHVGVYLERSADVVPALLGVLRAGAAYLPLDPDFPRDRVEMMVSDAGARVVVTQRTLADAAPGVTRIVLEDLADADVPLAASAQPHDAAYVIYTSGSTGRPKGVRIAHGSVVNLLRSVAHEPGIHETDVWLAITTLSFDISVLELFGPLLAGATVVVATREEVLDGARLAAALEREGATILQATPAGWRVLLESGWQGNSSLRALCGGEALAPELASRIVSRVGALWNMYGPTETTIWSTCYRVPESGSPVLIGRPVANTSVYVLDRTLRPVPPGVPGEIWIGGAGVALGYHQRDELNQERFLSDPFAGIEGARMYRTGDHGRLLRDGNLEYRNRVDNQVKIRGFRVEPGEIEAALVESGMAQQAAVVVRRGEGGDDRLLAYIVSHTDAPADAIRGALRDRLPGYMVPQHFVRLEKLPLTPNGKIDRKSLEAEAGDLPVEAATYVAPRTPHEQIVADVYADVLQTERIGADADFFDMGGHSVLAMRVIARLREMGASGLSLRDIFEASHVADLAVRLAALLPTAAEGADEDREVLVF